MPEPTLDVVAIGNAVVDVIARADDAFIASQGLAKGSMRLIDEETATALYDRMGPGIEASGGSAANTVAGLAALRRRCGFIGQVAHDQLGRVFTHDIRALGVTFDTAARARQPATAQCLILVSPDGQRTMNTFLGASQFLPQSALDADLIAAAEILYLEGYLWDPEEPRAAMRRAIAIAREAGRRVAFSLSDAFCIERHRADFLRLIEDGLIDILFANEAEILSLMEVADFDTAVSEAAVKVPLLVVTRGAEGALAVEDGTVSWVAAEPIAGLIDTTGAGDLFAAGFLAGQVEGRGMEGCLRMGAIAAAEVIQHYGARPETDLAALMANRLG